MEEYVSPDGRKRAVLPHYRRRRRSAPGLRRVPVATPTPSTLAAIAGLPEAQAVRRFVADLLGCTSVIVLWLVDGELRDVWVSTDPARDAGYADTPYALNPVRLWSCVTWDGRPWSAEPSPRTLTRRGMQAFEAHSVIRFSRGGVNGCMEMTATGLAHLLARAF